MWTGPAWRTLLSEVLLMATLAARSATFATPQPPDPSDEFFNPASLHDIRITMSDRDWSLLHDKYLDNTYYPCTFEWNGIVVGNATLRSRGSGSRNPQKPGLRVDFNRYNKSQRFLGLKYVVLDNFWQDPSMLRERVSMLLLTRLGVPAPREAHARIVVNDNYAGLYAAVEAPDEVYTARVLGSGDGYVYEYNWLNEWHFEYLGPDLAAYQMFDPKTHTSDPPAVLWGPFEQMVRTANAAPDATFAEDMSAYLDLPQFMRQVAIENFLAETDGLVGAWGLNNFYVYRAPAATRLTILQWDKDNTLRAADHPIMSGLSQNVITSRALGAGGLLDVYLAALDEAAAASREIATDRPERLPPDRDRTDGPARQATAGSSWLQREILQEYRQIRAAALADPFKATTSDGFEDAVRQLLDVARRRPDFVSGEVTKRRLAQVPRSR
jgi:spore coat protein CotH